MPEADEVEVPTSENFFLKYTGALGEADLPYMVVGAFAAAAYGEPRFSQDLDIVIHLPFADSERVQAVMEAAGCNEFQERRDPQWGHRLVAMTPEEIPIEFFFTPDHPLFNREFDRRRLVDVGEGSAWFASAEDMILRKLVNTKLRRKHDLRDAVAMLAVQGNGIDLAYLRAHCRPQRVCALLEAAIEEARREGA